MLLLLMLLHREELWIENTTYKDKLDEQADKINGIKHRSELI